MNVLKCSNCNKDYIVNFVGIVGPVAHDYCPHCGFNTKNKYSNFVNPLLSEVRAIANDALYFNDNSDYETALWEILKKVAPDMFDEYGNLKEGLKYSEN